MWDRWRNLNILPVVTCLITAPLFYFFTLLTAVGKINKLFVIIHKITHTHTLPLLFLFHLRAHSGSVLPKRHQKVRPIHFLNTPHSPLLLLLMQYFILHHQLCRHALLSLTLFLSLSGGGGFGCVCFELFLELRAFKMFDVKIVLWKGSTFGRRTWESKIKGKDGFFSIILG